MDKELQPASRLTVFVGGDERRAHQPFNAAVLAFFRELGINGATLTKGVMSYGMRRRMHFCINEVSMENLLVVLEAVDESRKIAAAADRVAKLLGAHGLVQVQPTMFVHLAPADREVMLERGAAKKLVIYVNAQEKQMLNP
jgi:PII-like signaling protein